MVNRRTDDTMAKSLKIPKGGNQEVVNGRTDNAMAKSLKIPKGGNQK